MTSPARRSWLPAWTASLTWKAAAFITVMCCALTALLGILVHVSVTRQTVGEARDRALSRLDEAAKALAAGDRLGPGAAVDPPGLPAPLRDLAARGRHGTMLGRSDTRPVMWAAGPASAPRPDQAAGAGRALAVEVDYEQSARTIDGLDNAILGSSVLAIGATLLVGAFAVTRVTRRLHTTARVARKISAGDLDARVNDPRTKDPQRHQDEVAAVAGALDSMASSLQARILTEQRFTADVAHELRTPLTGLHAAAELLPPGRPTELVRDRVAALRTLTEDLLEISRLDARSERVELDAAWLGPVAERVVRASGTDSGRTEVVVVRDVCVETDRRRLERVLGNLVGNAHRHGGPPVVLTVDGPVITVRDHGEGYPDYLVEHGPQRFRTEGGARGHGLGLTIAFGQAEVLGARLTFTNAADGGALATLTLPYDEPAPSWVRQAGPHSP
ncbi:HAMP domain-containing sensor histidine kinase [Streptomyces sp. NPDC001904]|uniref:HAMP domain-containing sensor histidine kinase n=1 Tax=Streptomyces sp. NPDC001904 TaxID=3154531 RepID=UPI0033250987